MRNPIFPDLENDGIVQDAVEEQNEDRLSPAELFAFVARKEAAREDKANSQ